MCGRFALMTDGETLATRFNLNAILADLTPRYNIAPSQSVAAIRTALEGGREWVMLRWGLIPAWAKDLSIGSRLVNARAETAPEKPAFRDASRHRRCLIPVDGFYEWAMTEHGKQPYFIHRQDRQPFAIAGLWEQWAREDSPSVLSCTLLTTAANRFMQQLHARMPAILLEADEAAWVDPTQQRTEALRALLRPAPEEWLSAYPVSRRVNAPKHDDVQCIEPL
jgi:putative SOS response-associated peptidase YedK